MRASLLIAAHNEGERLWRTVQSTVDSIRKLRHEVIVADDASEDGCVGEVRRRFPGVRVVSNDRRLGPSPTKDLAARHASGEILVFLDGHSKPEPGAVEHLVQTVRRLRGRAIVTPRILHLDSDRWENDETFAGYGFHVKLEDLTCGWIPRASMRWRSGFYESPTLVGCCFAMTRDLYASLQGFDPYMAEWGVEDIDLGLKCWLMGCPVLSTPYATVGHRFRGAFDNYTVSDEAILFNQLRMARKNFTDDVWGEWADRCRSREPDDVWRGAWERFCAGRETLERERDHLMSHRVHDELWYAERFGLDWPRRPSGRGQIKAQIK
ncbi:MAG: glycosyltransferase [Planctomycetes bacterium]|nr:glycosyltransferase [Planctomycetota bacterium]